MALAPYSNLYLHAPFIFASAACIALSGYGCYRHTMWEVLGVWIIVTLALTSYAVHSYRSNKNISFDDQSIYINFSGLENQWSYLDIILINRTDTRYFAFGKAYRKFKIVHKSNETVYFLPTHPERFEKMLKQLIKLNPECPIYI
ncbi:MAG: hypothetical protein WBG46_00565 [Nonlabens sp.]